MQRWMESSLPSLDDDGVFYLQADTMSGCLAVRNKQLIMRVTNICRRRAKSRIRSGKGLQMLAAPDRRLPTGSCEVVIDGDPNADADVDFNKSLGHILRENVGFGK